MKGLVFKEFMSMIEESYGDEIVEKIIDSSNLKTGGAYTSVGTYDHTEILQLVTHLSQETSTPVPVLVKAFGKKLSKVFIKSFPNFFKLGNSFALLKSVDGIIHVEVRKLYPDAELPKFTSEEPSSNVLILNYTSSRPFADLAEGLIEGVIEYYKENIVLTSTDTSEGKGTARRFSLLRSKA